MDNKICACKGWYNLYNCFIFLLSNFTKGIRKCIYCEDRLKIENTDVQYLNTYLYCVQCGNKAYLDKYFNLHVSKYHQSNNCVTNDEDLENYTKSIDGVFVQSEIISKLEEVELVSKIDSFEWVNSQSGRRKQDFGPKINFKKKKINFANFNGLPRMDMLLLEQIKKERLKFDPNSIRFNFDENSCCKNLLDNFETVEVCHLEYW